MQCEVCGRKLKSPESIAKGIGPECWKKLHKQNEKRNRGKVRNTVAENDIVPGQMELEDYIKSITTEENDESKKIRK